MATCTKAGLIDTGKCYTKQYFSRHDQMAILTYRLAVWADSVGGGSYASNLTGSLLTDSVDATCGLTNDQMEAALVGLMSEAIALTSVLFFSAGADAGAQASAVEAIKCLKNVDNRTLKAMQLYLACYLISRIAP